MPYVSPFHTAVNVTLWDFIKPNEYKTVSTEISHDKILADARTNKMPITSDKEFARRVAEEIFELSNDPRRTGDWEKHKARAVCTGDMIEMIFNDQLYTALCASSGWKVFEWGHPLRLKTVAALSHHTNFLVRTELVNSVDDRRP